MQFLPGPGCKFFWNIERTEKFLTDSITSGYRTLNLHIDGGNGTIYIHREVAKCFARSLLPSTKFVIHVNHKKKDNSFKTS